MTYGDDTPEDGTMIVRAEQNYKVKRRNKIARALIRLKFSLLADDEIAEYLQTAKRGLIEGRDVEIDTANALEEIIHENA